MASKESCVINYYNSLNRKIIFVIHLFSHIEAIIIIFLTQLTPVCPLSSMQWATHRKICIRMQADQNLGKLRSISMEENSTAGKHKAQPSGPKLRIWKKRKVVGILWRRQYSPQWEHKDIQAKEDEAEKSVFLRTKSRTWKAIFRQIWNPCRSNPQILFLTIATPLWAILTPAQAITKTLQVFVG